MALASPALTLTPAGWWLVVIGGRGLAASMGDVPRVGSAADL